MSAISNATESDPVADERWTRKRSFPGAVTGGLAADGPLSGTDTSPIVYVTGCAQTMVGSVVVGAGVPLKLPSRRVIVRPPVTQRPSAVTMKPLAWITPCWLGNAPGETPSGPTVVSGWPAGVT